MAFTTSFPPSFDVHNCESEPIHLLGRVQSHGLLLVLDADRHVVGYSGNAPATLGVDATALSLEALPDAVARTLQEAIEHWTDGTSSGCLYGGFYATDDVRYEIVVHQNSQNLILMEFIPRPIGTGERRNDALAYQHSLNRLLDSLTPIDTIDAFSAHIADSFKRMSGYDRVMVYRFDDEYNGQVIAEGREPGLESFFGLHYPASDIPPQARKLYESNLVRHISDMNDAAVPLLVDDERFDSIDLSHCFLRSVSPIHIRYLQNMGVAASLTLSLVVDGKLWGLIACHHYTPKYDTYAFLHSAMLLSRVLSSELARVLNAELERDYRALSDTQRQLIDNMNANERFMEALVTREPNITQLLNADSAMVFFSADVFTIGECPSKEDAARLLSWIKTRITPAETLYTSTCLSADYPPAAAYKNIASGVIVVFLSYERSEALVWFRREVVQTVSWAGDPNKAVVHDASGNMDRLQPRASFAEWKEIKAGVSKPWTPAELYTARTMRNPIVEMTLKQGVVLERLNQDLLQARNEAVLANQRKTEAISNMSHEVRTPLNSIIGYTELLKYGKAGLLTDDQQRYVTYAADTARHLLSIINDILDIAKIEAGTLALHKAQIDLTEIVRESLLLTESLAAEKGISIALEFPEDHPLVVYADDKRMKQILVNLISNAIKYNKQNGKVWIGAYTSSYRDEPYIVADIRDSGVGMDDTQLEHLFSRFYRVESGAHRKIEGTGLGLSITKQLVEMHHGFLQVSSKPGEGSQFKAYFPV